MTTMSSPPSASKVYEALHPGVKHWIYRKGWTQLREVQEKAGRHILFSDRDVIVAAPTAGGKTEAAFLPIASRLAEADCSGIGCLCISPLKALINDQYERLSSLFASVDRPLHPWHGDIAKTRKGRALQSRAATLLITPESLEAMFVWRGQVARSLFGSLAFVVVDELHAFIGTERGRHVQSLLHRLETMIGRRVRRIALSATLGDMEHAAKCLRPGAPENVAIAASKGGESALKLQVRGYVLRRPERDEKALDPEEQTTGGDIAISEHLFKVLRGSKNLVFANSRQRTELLASSLRRACERARVPCEFFPHHGSLSAEIRREAEARLKDPGRPATVVCTSTLELGIDVGAVKSVAQVGAPPSVASLRQRLGRSGRGTGPAVLRIYVEEDELTKDSPLPVALRLELVESIAMVELLLRDFCEPQNEERLHLSTLVHQILALIAERGGVRPAEAYRVLCTTGPFRNVSSSDFAEVLRAMGKVELITQMDDGVLVLGLRGEREVEHYSFHAVFQTPEEYRIVTDGKTLGSLPVTHVVRPGEFLIFAGRWWEVLDVNEKSKTITVRASRAGKAPLFFGSSGLVHDCVRAEMLRVLQSTELPSYLNGGARQLLAEGRATFMRYGLARQMIVQDGDGIVVIPWLGDRKLNTLQQLLRHLGFREIIRWGAALFVARANKADVVGRLRRHREQGDMSLAALVSGLEAPREEKFDGVLPPNLTLMNWASANLDPDVGGILRRLLDVGTPA